MPLYRDEAVVLRTHKLGEADRIVTLLTRHHGRVRAVAKGVRRTTSKFGARLEPFTHVDLQLAEGRNLDVDHPGGDPHGVLRRARARLRALHLRHGDARDGRAAGGRGEGAVAPAVRAAGRRAPRDGERRAATRAGARLLPAPLAGRRGLRAVVRRLRPLRPQGAAPLGQPVDGRRPVHHLPAARLRQPGAPRRSRVLGALLTGDWATRRGRRPAAPQGGQPAWSTAFVAWHLERSLRSMEYVER